MPSSQATYTESFHVYRHDGDHRGLVKAGSLLRYAQQIAGEHASAVGLTDEVYRATHTAYVLAKLALHVNRPAGVDEDLTLTTCPERTKRAVNKRITHMCDAHGAEVALLDSRWVLIDADKRTILRTRPEQFDLGWATDVPEELPMKMKKVPLADCEPCGSYRADYSRCDLNGHLNNTRYTDIICDALPLDAWEHNFLQDMLIFYHREVPIGEQFNLYRAKIADNQWYFAGERDGMSAFEATVALAAL